jgi:hypothetical protein
LCPRMVNFCMNRAISSIVLVRRGILSLFHRSVILVKALISILDYKRVHHTNGCWCSQFNAGHGRNVGLTLISAVGAALSLDLQLLF